MGSVTEKQQQTELLKGRICSVIISTFSLTIAGHDVPSRATTWHKNSRMGAAMRESFGNGIPDTESYKEWLAVISAVGIVALVWAVLFSP
jgi:hypothetical protein